MIKDIELYEINNKMVSLTKTEMQVLSKIIYSEDSHIAYDAISRGLKITTSRDELRRNGLIEVSDESKRAILTKLGKRVSNLNGIVDENGAATSKARILSAMQNESFSILKDLTTSVIS